MKKGVDFEMLVTASGDDRFIFDHVGGWGAKPLIYKVCYVPPYENPGMIRDIQLAARRHDVFCRSRICMVLDITEYVGHENDEYFVALVRFLYDHRDRWFFEFVVRHSLDRDVRKMYSLIRSYMKGTVVVDGRWENHEELASRIRAYSFDTDSSKAMAKLMFTEDFSNCRSEDFISDIADDVLRISGGSTITLQDLLNYAGNNSGMLKIIGGEGVIETIESYMGGKGGYDG